MTRKRRLYLVNLTLAGFAAAFLVVLYVLVEGSGRLLLSLLTLAILIPILYFAATRSVQHDPIPGRHREFRRQQPSALAIMPGCSYVLGNELFHERYKPSDTQRLSLDAFRRMIEGARSDAPSVSLCALMSKVEIPYYKLCTLEHIYQEITSKHKGPLENLDWETPEWQQRVADIDYVTVDPKGDVGRYKPIAVSLLPVREIEPGNGSRSAVVEAIVTGEFENISVEVRQISGNGTLPKLEARATGKGVPQELVNGVQHQVRESDEGASSYVGFIDLLRKALRMLDSGAPQKEVVAFLRTERDHLRKQGGFIRGERDYAAPTIIDDILAWGSATGLREELRQRERRLADPFVLVHKVSPLLKPTLHIGVANP